MSCSCLATTIVRVHPPPSFARLRKTRISSIIFIEFIIMLFLSETDVMQCFCFISLFCKKEKLQTNIATRFGYALIYSVRSNGENRGPVHVF